MNGLVSIIVSVVFLLPFVLISWFIPRRMGLIGVFIAHIAIIILLGLLFGTLIGFGGSYEGGEQIFLPFVFAIVLNMVLLPVTITAFVFNIRERRERRAQKAK